MTASKKIPKRSDIDTIDSLRFCLLQKMTTFFFRSLPNVIIMKIICLLMQVILTAFLFTAAAQKLSEPILLWPNGAPGATGTSDEDKPAVIPFIPEQSKRNGTAVLVVPGLGFTIRAVDHEGVLVAQWFREHGVAAFLLRYRLRPLYNRNDWVSD